MTARPVVVVLRAAGDDRTFPQIEADVEVRYADVDTLAEALPGAQVLLLWDFFSGALEAAWHRADALEWIHIAAAGVDTLLFDELVASPVVVTNSRGVFDGPIAEFVLAAILAFAKDLPGSLRLQQRGIWRHRETEEIAGTHAMIIGPGAIGRAVARLLTAVGMRVSGAGRTARDGDPDFGTVHASADLASVVGDVDHLVVIAPLTAQTRGLVDGAVLAALPAHARLINVGRGESVVTADLVAALEAGRSDDPARARTGIAGAALDVFDTEPLPADHPLWGMDEVLISAHMSGDVVGWRDRLAEVFVDDFDRYRAGTAPAHLPNVVDKERGFAVG